MSNLYQISENIKNLPENSSQSQSIMLHNINNSEHKSEKITIQPAQGQTEHFLPILQPFPQRPQKHEISFEKNFLLEHVGSLLRQLQNTVEFAFKIKPKQKGQMVQSIKSLYLSSGSSPSEVNVLSFLKSQHEPSWDIHMDIFQRAFEEDDDIQNFLKQVISFSTRQAAVEVITIVLDTYVEFKDCNFKFQQKKQILKRAHDWGKKVGLRYYQSGDFDLLNCKVFAIQNPEDRKSTEQRFEQFVRFLTSTVLLIMAGFFQNPYFDPSYRYQQQAFVDHHKRWFSDAFCGFLSDFEDDSPQSQSSFNSIKKSRGN